MGRVDVTRLVALLEPAAAAFVPGRVLSHVLSQLLIGGCWVLVGIAHKVANVACCPVQLGHGRTPPGLPAQGRSDGSTA